MQIKKIRELRQARPFQPFRICLADGREVPVTHPEQLAINAAERVIYVFLPDGSGTFIDLLLVTSLDLARSNGRARRTSGR